MARYIDDVIHHVVSLFYACVCVCV